ncbi:MAG: hypothetical protein K2X35_24345 [Bryobacteraceae bacterium]|nr:hypothetical protein [Bryobacteraceae bacterium]
MKRRVLSLIAAAAFASPIPETIRMETFDTVWKTIDRTYYDRTFNGRDWKAIRGAYEPKVAGTEDSAAFHDLLNAMTQELGVSHFRVAPPEKVHRVDGLLLPNAPPPATVGIDTRWIDNELLVTGIGRGSTAESAGVRRGWVIQRIAGREPRAIWTAERAGKRGFALRDELEISRTAAEKLDGPLDTSVEIEVRDQLGQARTLTLPRRPRNPVALAFESRRLSPARGYMRWNVFSGDLAAKFRQAIGELRDTSELVIDLRGNRGGAGQLAPALANMLIAGPGSLGVMKFRGSQQPQSYPGTGDQAYAGRLFILVDEWTGSTAEIFARGMQTNREALVIGTQTAGAVLPSVVTPLPTGGVLQYVIANYEDAGGVALERRGVTPDVPLRYSRQDLIAGRDAWLEEVDARGKARAASVR